MIYAGRVLIGVASSYSLVLEVYRLWLFNNGHWFRQRVGDLEFIAVDLTILVQAPAYFFIAAGEVLASITGIRIFAASC